MTSLSSKSRSSNNNSEAEPPSSSSLDAWTSEIRQASDDLTFATSKLESMFEELSSFQKEQVEGKSSSSLSSSLSMPTATTCNPIKLLRRLATLEYSMQRIRKDGLEVTQKRDELLDDLMETQQQNYSILRQISTIVD